MVASMGEQPIFTCQAHVFQINPETKKSWLPCAKDPVNVSFYYDSHRSFYRIISVDNATSKLILNTIVTPNMAFTKTSNKFTQFTDVKAGTVYGLGFGSENELNKFMDQFKEVKELTRASLRSNGSDSKDAAHSPAEVRSSTANGQEGAASPQLPSGSNSPSATFATPEAQLKYENDRLKIALAQSSANAKKWEAELQVLKNNNARLTAALQESTANVEEWKRQLHTYKEENGRLKKQSGVNGSVADTEEAQKKIELLELEKNKKAKEIEKLQTDLAQLSRNLEEQTVQLKNLEEENTRLKTKIEHLERSSKLDSERDQLRQLHTQMENRLDEMSKLSVRVKTIINRV